MAATGVRSPAVAGLFYPADPHELSGQVERLIREARLRTPASEVRPRAIVVPHAGYVYSGATAATAFSLLDGWSYASVVILGPAHRVPLSGLAACDCSGMRTPLGTVEVAPADGIPASGATHADEHSIEVQLPFLQSVLGGTWTVVPICVGSGDHRRAADRVEPLVREDTLLVVSSDLSHYEDIATARRHDRRTADAVLALEPDAIGPYDACGCYPLRTLVTIARRRQWQIRELDLRTSADTAGDPQRVVGYGAFVLESGTSWVSERPSDAESGEAQPGGLAAGGAADDETAQAA